MKLTEQPVSRRSFLTGAAAASAAILLGQRTAGAAGTTTRWVSETPRGAKDGRGFANAAPLASLPAIVAQVGAGGRVLLDATQPLTVGPKVLRLRPTGAAGAPVTIQGATPDGAPALAVLRSDRTSPWDGTGSPGRSWAALETGSAHVTIRNLRFEDLSRALWVAGPVPGLALVDLQATNIDRLLEVAGTAAVPGLRVRNVDVRGFTGPLLKLRSADGATIESVRAEAGGLPTDYVTGVALVGDTASSASSDVLIRDCTFGGLHGRAGAYLQGDGVTAEAHDRGITIRDTTITDCWDGGVDLKSADSVCVRVTVRNAKRSFRFHQPATAGGLRLIDCVSVDPVHPGGTGKPAHVQATGNVEVVRGSCSNTGTDVRLAEVSGAGHVRFDGTTVRQPGSPQTVGAVSGMETLRRS